MFNETESAARFICAVKINNSSLGKVFVAHEHHMQGLPPFAKQLTFQT